MDISADEENRQKLILTLLDMGFSYSDAENTLHSMNWDIEKAINHLSGTGSSSRSSSRNNVSEVATGIPIPTVNTNNINNIAEGMPIPSNGYFDISSRNTNNDDDLMAAWHLQQQEYEAARRTSYQPSSSLLQQQQEYENIMSTSYHRQPSSSLPPLPPLPPDPSMDPLLATPAFQQRCDTKLILTGIMVISFLAIIVGAFWTAWVFQNEQECGVTYDSARFTSYVDGDYRILDGNSCPGYDWTAQSTPGSAGEDDFSYNIPSQPVNCTKSTEVGTLDPTFGHIGYALNGVPIFSPADGEGRDAIEYEYLTYDGCGGHVKAKTETINKMFPGVPAPGDYHYHAMPGDTYPYQHSFDLNTNFTICDDVALWYVESEDTHSPIVGYMLDGFPIYGPRGEFGEAPTDLDYCGGHSSDKSFYHYHYKSNYPYSVNCLWGLVDGTSNELLNNADDCEVSDVQWSLDEINSDTVTYGGSGSNPRDDVGCLTVLSLGLFFFIYASIHFTWIYMTEKQEGVLRHRNNNFSRMPMPPPPPPRRIVHRSYGSYQPVPSYEYERRVGGAYY